MPTERYEILILGSRAGGKLLAWDMAGAGHRTAVIEPGGSAALVRTSTASRARTRSGARRSRTWSTTPRISGW